MHDSIEIARRFVGRVNSKDVGAMYTMMTDKHRFIDSEGVVREGRDNVLRGWKDYFRLVPDYAIDVERMFAEGWDVVILGTARGTLCRGGTLSPDDAWWTPAAWFARIRNGLVDEWRVYADNEPVRARMRADSV